MYAVVNRLTFAEPVGEAVAARFASAMPAIRESGCRWAHVVQTGEREVHLLIVFDSAEQGRR